MNPDFSVFFAPPPGASPAGANEAPALFRHFLRSMGTSGARGPPLRPGARKLAPASDDFRSAGDTFGTDIQSGRRGGGGRRDGRPSRGPGNPAVRWAERPSRPMRVPFGAWAISAVGARFPPPSRTAARFSFGFGNPRGVRPVAGRSGFTRFSMIPRRKSPDPPGGARGPPPRRQPGSNSLTPHGEYSHWDVHQITERRTGIPYLGNMKRMR